MFTRCLTTSLLKVVRRRYCTFSPCYNVMYGTARGVDNVCKGPIVCGAIVGGAVLDSALNYATTLLYHEQAVM